MIDQTVIDRIYYSVDIVRAIEDEGIALKKKGASYEGCCPFHQEKTPSFKVNPAKGYFKCFGCNEGGNVFGFIKTLLNDPRITIQRRRWFRLGSTMGGMDECL